MAVTLLNQLPVYKNPQGAKQIDNLTEAAPILKILPFEKALDGLFHKYIEVEAVDSLDINKPMDAPLRNVSVARGFRTVNLGIIDGLMEVGEDFASQVPGGYGGYFAQQIPLLMSKLGQEYEQDTIYKAWLPYALAMNDPSIPALANVIDAGGTGTSNYSLIVVRFQESVFGGLFDPAIFNRATLVEEKPMSGGQMYLDSEKRSVYGMRFKGHLGNLMASKRNISAIVNIDAGTTAGGLTVEMIEQALLAARVGDPGRAYIFCHPQVRAFLNKIGKADHIQTSYANDRKVDVAVDSWGGATIVPSYNFFPGTESRVVV